MISKNDILKFVRHVHRRGQGIPDRRPMHPKREWLIGLFIFLMVTGTGAVLSMMTFEYYKNIDKRTYSVDLTTPTYNSARAKTVLDDFNERRIKYGTLIESIPEIEVTLVEIAATTSTTTEQVTVPVATTTDEFVETVLQ